MFFNGGTIFFTDSESTDEDVERQNDFEEVRNFEEVMNHDNQG